ncbi:MAG: sodium-dependent transporter [Anaeromicrobium sp.]|jgi:NSS family neurotransmitter:Na+ symporter|uniref:sodium-dependent transporter n=1 Tax=Anaeromicrobium sp. TaxID=1929132 RepID=UPI0025D08962|nr:sodium-dependent transporter [Anaeromicrobium sp.]MCT4593121.1 sodium-dependent transporter [Anaeromicrobium sp.]
MNSDGREQWGSKIGFLLAAAGSAVGLGNLWKFPYMAGKNGGGVFVVVYLGILITLGFTLMAGELTLGRFTQLNAIGAYRKISKKLTWVGAIGVFTAFLILSFYSVIGGWVINYIIKTCTGALNTSDSAALGDMFGQMISDPVMPIVFHGVFMIATLVIVLGGIGEGIEKASKVMMPALLVMIVALAIRSVTLPGAEAGLEFFLKPDFSKLNGALVLDALGQVFFSLSLGMGIIITYGSYLPKEENIPQSAVYIPLIDTAVALLAGFAILPAVFALGFEPTAGPGLMFITLPAVFAKMPFGTFFGLLFFVLVLLAALTSSISLLEVCVSYVVDEWGWDRKKTTLTLGFVIFAVGVPASLSLGPWADVKIFGKGFFDLYDYVTQNIFLPLGGLMSCITIGWVWGVDNAIKEATNNGKVKFALGKLWGFLIKYIAPLAIGKVFYDSFIVTLF